MKVLLSIFLLTTTLNGINPNWEIVEPDFKQMGLKGDVISISQRIYRASKFKNTIRKRHLELDPLENWDITFNKKGFINSKKCFGADNELIFYYEYKYKQKRQIFQKVMYDHRNYTIEKIVYVYNHLGQLAAESVYRADGSLLVRYIHDYSPKGLLLRTDVHAPTPNVYTSSRYEFDYNKSGRLEEQRTYDSYERLHQTDNYAYDNNGFVKKHVIYNHFNNFSFSSFSRHDENGNLITFQAPAESTPSISYTYVFDKTGNWTSRTHYKNGKVQNIVERNIQYKTRSKAKQIKKQVKY